MIEPQHPKLAIVEQCALIGISRSAYCGTLKGESPLNLSLMRLPPGRLMGSSFSTRRGTLADRWRGTCVGWATSLGASASVG
jgi:putative transposase